LAQWEQCGKRRNKEEERKNENKLDIDRLSHRTQLYFGETDRAACCVRAKSSEASRDTMTSSNVSRLHEYLQAVASMGPYETVADFYTADVTIQEFPNRIAPHGRVRRLSDARAAYEQGRQVLMSQAYRVQRILEAGNELAVELEWTGILAVSLMNLPAKSEMKAFVAMFLTFRDGKIAAQRNYDCYPPFDPQTTSD
jgi:ketosteroid isomerase-like protein